MVHGARRRWICEHVRVDGCDYPLLLARVRATCALTNYIVQSGPGAAEDDQPVSCERPQLPAEMERIQSRFFAQEIKGPASGLFLWNMGSRQEGSGLTRAISRIQSACAYLSRRRSRGGSWAWRLLALRSSRRGIVHADCLHRKESFSSGQERHRRTRFAAPSLLQYEKEAGSCICKLHAPFFSRERAMEPMVPRSTEPNYLNYLSVRPTASACGETWRDCTV